MSEEGFWRIEIWHPLSVHFPIALLIFATLMMAIALLSKNEYKVLIQKLGSILLYTGCFAAWISIFTGDLAEGTVARKICDPTVLKRHETGAYIMAYFFSAASIINLMLLFKLLKNKLIPFAQYLIFLMMLIGTGYLVYVGHLGASLVYEQGAGVKIPTSDCTGY